MQICRIPMARISRRLITAITCTILLSNLYQANADDSAYLFQQDMRPIYTLSYGDVFVRGHLDAAGNFIPIPGDHRNILHPVIVSGTHVNYLRRVERPNEPVYEFRSGRLIPGILNETCRFLPTVGAKIIDFKDYHYGKDARRIYNLPGRFVKARK